MKFTLERKALPRLLMLFGSSMTFSFGLLSAFIPSLAHLNGFIRYNYYYGFTTGVNPPPSYVKPPYYLTPWMIVASMGGLLGLVAYLINDKKSIFLSFSGTSTSLSGFLLFIYEFITEPHLTAGVRYLFIPWLGLSLTFLGVLMMFAGSVQRFRVIRPLLYIIVPSLVATMAYNILVITNNIPFILLIAQSFISNIIIGLSLLLTLLLVFIGSVLCTFKTLLGYSPVVSYEDVS